MKTITLKKPSGETFQVNDRRNQPQANNFQVNGPTGYVDTKSDDEMLLPLGYTLQANGKIETQAERIKRKSTNEKPKPRKQVNEDSEVLYPIGVNPQ
ncbi:hypothetical protein ACKGJO_09235 [Gracilimonas sp. Q87]|uniref:hypothetical protein n=1 Tax=Gracilimonas sp. Q87 TaxID=3384766 RepID=UPI003983DE7C